LANGLDFAFPAVVDVEMIRRIVGRGVIGGRRRV